MKGNVPSGPGLDVQTKKLLEQLKEKLEVGEGQRGDPLGRYLKIQDLLDLGLAKLIGKRAQNIVTGGNLQPNVPVPNMNVPPAPTGFTVSGGLSHIFLQWDDPLLAYSNHAYTLIYRNTEDNIANAQIISQVAISSIAADLDVSYGTDYYYWIRFVSEAGIQGPFNSSVGTLGKVSEDPAALLALLQNKITESQLYEDLNARIDLIDGPPELSGSVAARVLAEAILRQNGDAAEASARNTAIASAISQMEQYADEDSASALLLDQLITAFGGNVATALDFIVTEVDENSATATSLAALTAAVNSPTTGLATKASTTYVNEAVADEAAARASAFSLLSAEIDNLDGEVSNRATIAYVDDAVADEAGARATAISQLSSEVDSYTTIVETTASTVDGISGQYTVKIDNNGVVSGYGLSSETVNGQTNSFFLVNADTFGIVNSGAAKTVTSLTRSSTTATAACSAHGLQVGDKFSLSNIYEPGWNGVWTVATVPNANSFTFTVPATLTTPATARIRINGKGLSSLTRSSITATATFLDPHGLFAGQVIDVSGVSQAGWNGQWQITNVPSSTSVQFIVPPSLVTPATSLMRAAAQTIPFVVDAGKVVMDGAFIKNATINDAQVGTITVAKITGVTSSFLLSTIGTGNITNAYIGNIIESTGYSPGSTGWSINKNGTAEFRNITARGDIEASSLKAGNIYTGTIQSTPFVSGSTGWRILASGAAEFNDVVISRPNVVAYGDFFPAANNTFYDDWWTQEGRSPVGSGGGPPASVVGWGPRYRDFMVDTGYDNVNDVFNLSGGSFEGRALVTEGFSTWGGGGPGTNKRFDIEVSCSAFYSCPHFATGSPATPGGRVMLSLRVSLPRNRHASLTSIRIDKIEWSLMRMT